MRINDPDIFRVIAESLQIGVYVTDRDRRIVFWNREAVRISGYLSHEVVGKCCGDALLTHCDADGKILCISQCPMNKAMQEGAPQEARVFLHHRAGHRVPVRVRAFPVRGSDGAVIGAVEVFEEQASAVQSERHLDMLAMHELIDRDTGLPNRAIMQSYVRGRLELYTEHKLPVGVLLIQIVHTSEFQAAHSREALKAILHVVARSISHALGVDCLLGHWSDDQFLALIPDCNLVDLERLGRQVRQLVSCSGMRWWGDELSVAIEAGYAISEEGDDVGSLLHRAQHSLERAREAGIPSRSVRTQGDQQSGS